MSKQIHREEQRRQQVKFRAPESLVEEFDEAISTSRSEALREMMQQRIGRAGELDVPDDKQLAEAYRWLVEYTNRKGSENVRLRVAKNHLSQMMSMDEGILRGEVLIPLEKRGYIRIQDSPPGYQADGSILVREFRRDT